jgi:hypothetical protein
MESEQSQSYEKTLAAVHNARQIVRQLMVGLAVEAVTNRAMTRKEVGEAIGVHPLTISRWITAREVEQSQLNKPPQTEPAPRYEAGASPASE